MTQEEIHRGETRRPATRVAALVASGLLLVSLLAYGLVLNHQVRDQRLVLAPMIGALGNCLLSRGDAPNIASCGGLPDSAARVIESTLDTLGPRISPDGKYELGYTLNVPLLRMFHQDVSGRWVVDQKAARRVANTIRQSDRPLVLYLFSTHFGVGGPLEAELARDAANLSVGPDGRPMPKDKYYDVEIFPWTVATATNSLTRMRETAMNAVLEEICALPSPDRLKVKGVTILGEVHHLFPGFETGMGISTKYQVSDYSMQSVQGFRDFLRYHFNGDLAAFNQAVGGDYDAFTRVQPPSRDIRTQRLSRFQDHIDSYAGGTLPVSGWLHVADAMPGNTPWVHVFVNGVHVGRTPANLSRQDVLEAKPALGTADVGWRHDIDFSAMPLGMHRVDMSLEYAGQPLQHLGMRMVGIVGPDQANPIPVAQTALPPMQPPHPATSFWIDTPQDQLSLYYNPLVNLWHEFRQTQVTQYLQHFAGVVRKSCMRQARVFTHQIVPWANPGWDSTRFAIDGSLRTDMGMELGVSLYGRAAYGPEVIQWLQMRRSASTERGARAGSRVYGVTEFHPLKAMSGPDLEKVFDQHAAEGAAFISFFMEPRRDGQLYEPGGNMFSFDPANPISGSDVLYRSVADIMRGRLAHDRADHNKTGAP